MGFDFENCWVNIQGGDEDALKALFLEVNKPLCFYTQGLVKDLFIAQELVQDLFLKIWEQRLEIIISSSFRSYLFKMAHHMAINYLIQNKTQKTAVNQVATENLWLGIKDNYLMNDFLIEKLEAEDTQRIIYKTLENLPGQCQKIFLMSRFHHKKGSEIADSLGISVNTVRTQIYRALDKIREALNKIN